MAIEDNALSFVIDIENVGKFEGQIGKILDGLDKISDAAESAHKAAESGGTTSATKKSFFEKMTSGASEFLSRVRNSEPVTKLLAKTTQVLNDAASDALSTWVDYYHTLIDWRKEVGMDIGKMQEFSGLLVDSTRRYTFALRTATSVASTLALGTKKFRKEMVDLSASLAQFETLTGASGEGLSRMARLLIQNLEVMDEDHLQRSLWSVRNLFKDLNIPFSKFVEFANENTEVLAIWGRNNKNILTDLAALEASLYKVGLSTEDVSTFMGKLDDRGSLLFRTMLEAGGDVRKFFEITSRATEGLDLATLSEADLIALKDKWQIPATALKGLKIQQEDVLDIQRKLFESLQLSAEQQAKQDRARATGLEKLKLIWLDVKNAGAEAFNEATKIFEGLVPLVEGPGRVLTGWLTGLSDKLESIHRTLIQVGLIEDTRTKKEISIGKLEDLRESFSAGIFGTGPKKVGELAYSLFQRSEGDLGLLTSAERNLVRRFLPQHYKIWERHQEAAGPVGTTRVDIPDIASGASDDSVAKKMEDVQRPLERLVELEEEKKRDRRVVGVPLSTAGSIHKSEAARLGVLQGRGM